MTGEQERPGPVIFGYHGDDRKWVQLANTLARQIHEERYRYGEWLPTLAELAGDLGTNPGTLTQVIREMAARGLITRVPCYGCYVGTGPMPSSEPPGNAGRRKPKSRSTTRMELRAARSPAPRAPVRPAAPSPARTAGAVHAAPSASPAEEEFVFVKEVAAQLRVSVMTVYRMVHDGDLEAIRVGRSIRITATSFAAYRKGSEIVPGSWTLDELAALDQES